MLAAEVFPLAWHSGYDESMVGSAVRETQKDWYKIDGENWESSQVKSSCVFPVVGDGYQLNSRALYKL